jgi:hypothetical protein
MAAYGTQFMDFSRLTPYPGDGVPMGDHQPRRDAAIPPVEPDYIFRYRRLRTDGLDRDTALGVLRQEGASFFDCMVAAAKTDGLSAGDAKAAVHQSPAWADEYEAREEFWREIEAAFDDLPYRPAPPAG